VFGFDTPSNHAGEPRNADWCTSQDITSSVLKWDINPTNQPYNQITCMSLIMGDLLSSISYISLLDFRPTTASLASAVLAELWRGNASHQRPQHPGLAARLERPGTSLVSVMKRWVHMCCFIGLLYGWPVCSKAVFLLNEWIYQYFGDNIRHLCIHD